jgi:hypothetical protein
VTAVHKWSGREASALRAARRMTIRGFAEYLGISPRTVANWQAKGHAICPLPEMQEALDTALAKVGPDARLRFEVLLQSDEPALESVLTSGSPPYSPLPGLAGTGSTLHGDEAEPHLPDSPATGTLLPIVVDGQYVFLPVDRHDPLDWELRATLDQADGPQPTAASPLRSRPARSRHDALGRGQLTTAAQVDDILQHLRNQWHLLVKTDNLFGPRYALRGVLDQLRIIDDLLRSVRETARTAVIKVGAKYAESAAWLYEDSGNLATARYWNGRAMEWAFEADDRPMLAWTLFRSGQHATVGHDGGLVIDLAQAARREAELLSAPMRAAIAQQEGQGYALDGKEAESQRMFDEAHQWAATDTDGDARDGHGSFCTESYIEMQRAGSWLALDRPARAIELYDRVLPNVPAVYRRDRGMALGRLASAHMAANQPEQAASVAREALAIAQSAGSTRTLSEVASVGQRLRSHQHLPVVAQLLDELIQPA